jgi:hypothetical protein
LDELPKLELEREPGSDAEAVTNAEKVAKPCDQENIE